MIRVEARRDGATIAVVWPATVGESYEYEACFLELGCHVLMSWPRTEAELHGDTPTPTDDRRAA